MNTFPVKNVGGVAVEEVRMPGMEKKQLPAHPLMKMEEGLKNGTSLEQELETFYKPIKQQIMMELKAVAQVGRLGGLDSSRLHMDIILGRDEEIGPDDYLPLESEKIVNIPQRYIDVLDPEKN